MTCASISLDCDLEYPTDLGIHGASGSSLPWIGGIIIVSRDYPIDNGWVQEVPENRAWTKQSLFIKLNNTSTRNRIFLIYYQMKSEYHEPPSIQLSPLSLMYLHISIIASQSTCLRHDRNGWGGLRLKKSTWLNSQSRVLQMEMSKWIVWSYKIRWYNQIVISSVINLFITSKGKICWKHVSFFKLESFYGFTPSQ